jgi:hypothetical protein
MVATSDLGVVGDGFNVDGRFGLGLGLGATTNKQEQTKKSDCKLHN